MSNKQSAISTQLAQQFNNVLNANYVNLEHIQNALFYAYDIQNTLDARTLKRKLNDTSFDETINDALNEIIDFLQRLEHENTPVDDDIRSNGPRG